MSGAATKPAAAEAAREQSIEALAERAVAHLKKRGAESAVVVERRRGVECDVRARAVEKLQESISSSLSVGVYADGRYSSHSTSDLAWPSLEKFLDDAVAMTRVLEADPFRTLPDPKLYEGRFEGDLGIADPAFAKLDAAARKAAARAAEEAAIAAAGEKLQSATASVSDGWRETVRVTSNGFRGREEATSFTTVVEATLREGDKRPEGFWYHSARRRDAAGNPADVGREAARRALARIGSQRVAGGAMTVIVEASQAGRLLGHFLRAATAMALQQKSSFLEGMLGKPVAADTLTIADDPHIPGALGSRAFDGEGIAAKRTPFLEGGVLRNYFIDWYYGRKLGLAPTTAGPSNLVIAPGKRSLEELIKATPKGLLVTSFLGGNSNPLTGDFSLGIQGERIESGARAGAVGEMNLAGNHKEFWKRLVEVGSDPWTASSVRTPTLVFEGASIAGA